MSERLSSRSNDSLKCTFVSETAVLLFNIGRSEVDSDYDKVL